MSNVISSRKTRKETEDWVLSLKIMWYVLLNNFFLKKKEFLEDISPFLWGHWYPYFGLLVTSTLGFKASMDSLACVLHCLHVTDSSNSSLLWQLLTSGQPAWQPSCFIHILAYKHWWGLSAGSSVPLPHSMWQDRCSTDWALQLGF